jgi:hypothetical protein
MNLYRIYGDETTPTKYSDHERVGRLIAAPTAELALSVYKERYFPEECKSYEIFYVGPCRIVGEEAPE